MSNTDFRGQPGDKERASAESASIATGAVPQGAAFVAGLLQGTVPQVSTSRPLESAPSPTEPAFSTYGLDQDEEGLERSMQDLSIAGNSRSRGRSVRPAQTSPADAGLRTWPYQSPEMFGGMRFHQGQIPPMQWIPYHPGMAYNMYGDMRPSMFYGPQLQGPPVFQPGFYPPQQTQQLSGPFQGPRLSAPMLPGPGYYFPARLQVPSLVRQRTPKPAKPQQQSSEAYDFDLEEAEQNPGTCRKTLMLRNIPNKYSIHMLLEMLDSCHKRSANELVYDFCYLPIDFKNRCNLGYAFVNFVKAPSAIECYKAFHEKRWNDFNSKKVCEVKYARVQGREALIDHFKNSKFPSNDTDSLPLLFEEVEQDDGSKEIRSVPLHSRQPN